MNVGVHLHAAFLALRHTTQHTLWNTRHPPHNGLAHIHSNFLSIPTDFWSISWLSVYYYSCPSSHYYPLFPPLHLAPLTTRTLMPLMMRGAHCVHSKRNPSTPFEKHILYPFFPLGLARILDSVHSLSVTVTPLSIRLLLLSLPGVYWRSVDWREPNTVASMAINRLWRGSLLRFHTLALGLVGRSRGRCKAN